MRSHSEHSLAPALAGAFRFLMVCIACVLVSGMLSAQPNRGEGAVRQDSRPRDPRANTPSPRDPVDTGVRPSTSILFTDVTDQSGLHRTFGIDTPTEGSMAEAFGGGVAAGDYDGDGDVDLYLVSGDAKPNQLFENQGNNTFVDVAPQVGLALTHKSSGPTFADIDGDGDLDLFLGGVEGEPLHLFRNQDGIFEDITPISGLSVAALNTVSAAFADYDSDGDLDMFIAHWGNLKAEDTEHLWQNQGDGSFRGVSIESGISAEIVRQNRNGDFMDFTFAPNFADIDNDGDLDLLVTGDFGTSQVYMNNGDQTFERVTDPAVIVDQNGMGAAVGDYDNDGDLDWFVSAIFNMTTAGRVTSIGNVLYRNMGDGNFEDVSYTSGITRGGWGWGASFADFDNDGDLDLFHTNGWNQAGRDITDFRIDPVKLWMNNGDGTFSNMATEAKLFDNGMGRGIACFDSDRDGDVDILITNNSDPGVVLYRNDFGNTSHFMNIKLIGPSPNTSAIGARIYLTVGETTQMRVISIGSNYASHNPAKAHFGLGASERAEQIRIQWPDGKETMIKDIAVDQFLTIRHPDL